MSNSKTAAVATALQAPITPPEPSLIRLYALRAGYLMLVVGLGIQIWPGIFSHEQPWELMQGVVNCMLAALSALALLGLRYPLQMLPLLLFELTWKAIWLSAVGLPLWYTGRLDAGSTGTATACLMGAVFVLVIPWRYVARTYVMTSGDRWHSL